MSTLQLFTLTFSCFKSTQMFEVLRVQWTHSEPSLTLIGVWRYYVTVLHMQTRYLFQSEIFTICKLNNLTMIF